MNYTNQDFSGGSTVDTTSGRGLQVLGDVSIRRGLLDFSEDAYNITMYYEKYGVSARARYTWREGFRTQDFGGGANTSGSSTFSFPVNTLDRGQLNASISYDVPALEGLTLGVEAVNLTEERIRPALCGRIRAAVLRWLSRSAHCVRGQLSFLADAAPTDPRQRRW